MVAGRFIVWEIAVTLNNTALAIKSSCSVGQEYEVKH
jgi:hypothetical protein